MTVQGVESRWLTVRRRIRTRRGGRPAIGYLLAAPLVLWLIIVLAYPLGNMVMLSLTDAPVIGAPSNFVGLDNYQAVLQSAAFWKAVRTSAIWLLANVVLGTVLAFSAALLLRRDGWFARRARVWVLLPWVIPTVAVAVIWQWMLNDNYGVVNFILKSLHIIGAPLNVFGSKNLALAGTTVANTWHWFPLSALVIFGAMQTVPPSLYEAARIDGANAWALFRYITMPAIGKVLFALGLVGGLWTFNVFDMIYLTTRGGPADATLTVPLHVYDTAFKGLRIGEAAAMSVITIGLLAVMAAGYVKFLSPPDD